MRRREFLKTSMLAGLAAAAAPRTVLAGRSDRVRIGLIGVGLRGTSHLELLLSRQDTELRALCDIDPRRLETCRGLIAGTGRPSATEYTGSEYAYRDLLARDDIDAVIISTPWLWHVPMAVDAMKAGKYTGLEVSGAASVEECWELVRMHESTGTELMFLENVSYRRDVMAVLEMVRGGLFGELIHCQGGYQHDLRGVKFDPGVEFGEKGVSEARWRTQHSVLRNGELYPTHGLGPLVNFLGINRGNRLVSLTSTATKSRGLHQYIVDNAGPDHPNAHLRFRLGDVVTTVIRCAGGEVIVLNHDTNLPRPYSLGFRVQGTKGLWMDDGDQIYLEGTSPQAHRWEPAQPYLDRYDHDYWRRHQAEAAGAGHGGMDYFVLNDFINAVRRQVPPPIDVYDAAAMMVVTPLSEQSIAAGSAPQAIPDFTDGRWIHRRPVFGMDPQA